MANTQIDMRKVKKIFKLYSQGISKRKISVQIGVSRNTVTKYISFFQRYKLTSYEVSEMTIEDLHKLFKSSEKRKSDQLLELEQYFPYFDKEIRKTGVTQRLLWEEYKEKHPDGYQLAQFCYWYREWRKEISPVMHLNHKAGDKLFIDFTGKKLTLVDEHTGELQELEVFVCVLGSSQYTYVEACESQKKEDFIRCVENALWFYGGVPDALVTDNLRAAVTKSSKYEPKVNETFASFAEHYETTVLPTRAYKPRDKAIVENAVRIIYTRVFAPLRNQTFHNKASINNAILELLKIHNQMSFRGRDYSRVSLFEEVEQQALKPLPEKRYELKQYATGTVHKNSHIYFNKDKHYYSAPYKYIGKKVRIIYSNSLIEIYHKNELIALHTRDKRKYQYTTEKEHMPSYHRFVSEWSSERFIAWASDIGKACKAYIIKILDKKQHPEQSYKSCLGILYLAKKVTPERLNNACKRALDYGAYNYKMIERILDKGWDSIEEPQEVDQQLPLHKNIRGKDYYK
ncbi:IS21 family transposase [Kordia sp.]|uniref:IS21 family transposase n=1 Tax=Kordia sp. TaxID=1965332 RepID=UPI0025C3B67A|nr:IS21 family transposase [Kordia sp.]MCH2197049.1 IS21 family transposase [Kordia sp.]